MVRILLLVLGAVVVVAAVGVASAYVVLSHAIGRDIARLNAEARGSGLIVSEAMLAGLPAPAQRYFRHAGVVGTAIPSIVRLTQTGRIRSSAQANWMELEAEEIYSVNPPAFVWRAWFPRRGLPLVIGRDEYLGGAGSIVMKLLALVPVAEERGDELRAAGLMRFLNEMVWFPAAYLGDNVRIGAVDERSFTVTIADRGITVTGTLVVDEAGRAVTFRARRYNTTTRSIEMWETPMTEEGMRAGLRLPTAGSALWKLPGGDFTYIELGNGEIVYDPP
jgi:hypothetical protein